MTDTAQVLIRLTPSLKDKLNAMARWEKKSTNALVRKLIEDYTEGKLAPVNEDKPDTTTDPYLLRVFSDTNFDIMEWVTDEPGKGETTQNVGARVRGGTLRIVQGILSDPRCPYTTISDFLRDAILTLAYIITKGRFHDERAAAFAARERIFAREVANQERVRALLNLFNEVQAFVSEPGGSLGTKFEADRAFEGYKRVAELIKGDVPKAAANHAFALLDWCRNLCRPADLYKLDDEYPDVKAALDKREG